MSTEDPITHACRLLRESAQELACGVSIGDVPDWANEPDAKAAHDEHMAAAAALEKMTCFEAGDMASASAQGFRDGQASQAQPVANMEVKRDKDGLAITIGPSSSGIDLPDGEYPLYAAPQPVGAAQAKVLGGVIELAKAAHAHWDADRDAKVGKILMALAGWNEGYDWRADALHTAAAAPQPAAQALDARTLPGIKDMHNAPQRLNLNDRAFWVLGWNECRDAVRGDAIAAKQGGANG